MHITNQHLNIHKTNDAGLTNIYTCMTRKMKLATRALASERELH